MVVQTKQYQKCTLQAYVGRRSTQRSKSAKICHPMFKVFVTFKAVVLCRKFYLSECRML